MHRMHISLYELATDVNVAQATASNLHFQIIDTKTQAS